MKTDCIHYDECDYKHESSCCNAKIIHEDICSDCKEHCSNSCEDCPDYEIEDKSISTDQYMNLIQI